MDLAVHLSNRGLGETIRDALRLASEVASDDDLIVTMDADNTHPPELIPEMIRHIKQGADVVIASRYRPGARVVGLSRFRRSMSLGARLLFGTVFPIEGVRDYTCGFRMYRPSVLRRAFETYGDRLVSERGFACMAEILLKVSRLRVRCSEVPLVLGYNRKKSVSMMRVGRTVMTTLGLMTRLRFG